LAGIYIHIPFCKQACHYCNFHFSTSLRNKNGFVAALLKETALQQNYLLEEPVETIYFGGGTPSLMEIEDLKLQIDMIRSVYSISKFAEITIEANPDDISEKKLTGWKEAGINRLSIGIQSFFDEDLKWMNRAHNAEQSIQNLQLAIRHFDNISVDLIYGIPILTNEKWKQNVDTVINLSVPHVSCYALTVEEKTQLYKMIRRHEKENIDPDKQSGQFLLLMDWLTNAGYEHYEISNFAKPGFRSRHNTSYWQGKKYLGLGPSAHSFNGTARQWNISNNNIYIESINKGIIPFEKEELTSAQQLNEYIMISLRTMEGLDLGKIDTLSSDKLQAASKRYIDIGLMKLDKNHLVLTKEGKFLADGIAASLFF
jgi:oxygen-independent coproporphyrinogen-3 oxidase